MRTENREQRTKDGEQNRKERRVAPQLLALCAMLFALCLSSGCAEMLVTHVHNQGVRQRAQAVQVRADQNGVAVLVDLLGLDGYFGAWKQYPWTMTGATAADVVTGLGIYGLTRGFDKSSPASVVNINATATGGNGDKGGEGGEGGRGGDATININIGNGNGSGNGAR